MYENVLLLNSNEQESVIRGEYRNKNYRKVIVPLYIEKSIFISNMWVL
jgi:hypothetical protein